MLPATPPVTGCCVGRTAPPAPHRVRVVLVVVVVTAAVLGLVAALVRPAAATTLGGIRTGGVVTQSLNGPALPGLVVRDTFSSGTDLAARSADTGQRWTVHKGQFTVASGSLMAANDDGAAATVDAGRTTFQMGVTLAPASRAAVGLVVASEATGGAQLWALVTRQGKTHTVSVVRVVGATRTVLAEVPVDASVPRELAVTRTTDRIVVTWGGQQELTVTFTAAERSALAGMSRVGVVADGDNRSAFSHLWVVA